MLWRSEPDGGKGTDAPERWSARVAGRAARWWQRWKAPFPLLGKDLVEQAARRRTYVVRVLYAVALFAIFCLMAQGAFEQETGPSSEFSGSGKWMFEALVVIQFAGILLFLPATMSGALTYEKERGSLALLLLTSLRPREILLQKYLGRLIPMFTFLLLGLPLLAICYGFGGITTDYLTTGIYVLVLTCLQVGALALLCSAFCCTSLGALISSYVLTAALYIGLPFLFILLGASGNDSGTFFLMPLTLFFEGAYRRQAVTFDGALSGSIFILVSIVLFLILAKVFLVSRAFRERKNRLLSLFRWLDRAFERANRLIGGLRLGRDRESLPEDEPIAWREVARRSLGKPLYLFRILVILEVPILFISASAMLASEPYNMRWVLSMVFYGTGILAVLAVAVTSANAIASERMGQTLETLLTTPLSGADIVRQKRRGIRRLRRVLLVPLATCLVVMLWWGETWSRRYDHSPHHGISPLLQLGLIFVAVVVFLALFSWVGFWLALKARTRFKAIIATLTTLVVWNVLPPLLFSLILESSRSYRLLDDLRYMLFLSPGTCVVALAEGPGEWLGTVLGFLVGYAAIAAILRLLCLRRADRYLGRATGSAPPPMPLHPGAVSGILAPDDLPPPHWG